MEAKVHNAVEILPRTVRDLKEASEATDRRSGSREFHTERATCSRKGASYKNIKRLLTVCENRRAHDDRSCVAGCLLWPPCVEDGDIIFCPAVSSIFFFFYGRPM